MKTLLVDGNWALKRAYFSHKNLVSDKMVPCGALIGFLQSLKSVVDKIFPDRIIVCWDGFNAGKLRYDLYKPYKENRKKDWTRTERALITEGVNATEEERKEFEIIKQKLQIRNVLDELFVRQVEVDFIEADDLIAEYILRSEDDNEQIFIYSRDKDFLQLISDKVFIVSPDNLWTMGKKEYEEKFKMTVENELMFKCFDGDSADCIKGVNGITRDTLVKYFPDIIKEKYTYNRLVEESTELQKKKKLKVFEKIINAREVLYRNARLMDLKRPFLNVQAKKEVDIMKHGVLGSDRDITDAIKLFHEYGIANFIGGEFLSNYLSSFYSIMLKEKEYAKTMEI